MELDHEPDTTFGELFNAIFVMYVCKPQLSEL